VRVGCSSFRLATPSALSSETHAPPPPHACTQQRLTPGHVPLRHAISAPMVVAASMLVLVPLLFVNAPWAGGARSAPNLCRLLLLRRSASSNRHHLHLPLHLHLSLLRPQRLKAAAFASIMRRAVATRSIRLCERCQKRCPTTAISTVIGRTPVQRRTDLRSKYATLLTRNRTLSLTLGSCLCCCCGGRMRCASTSVPQRFGIWRIMCSFGPGTTTPLKSRSFTTTRRYAHMWDVRHYVKRGLQSDEVAFCVCGVM
jgi:hypothetical protein